MKKIIISVFIYILVLIPCIPVYSAVNTNTITKIENELFGFDYTNDNSKSRVERIEKTIYGKVSTGDINKRIKRISDDISADLIGMEIPPKEDTFREDDDDIKETAAKADSSVNYPVVDEIEQKLFNKTYKDRDFHTRIVTIERKLFGKIYDVDDYAARMDRIKAKVMPETIAQNNNFDSYENADESNNEFYYSQDLSGIGNNRFGMPFGQRNYTRPYANYGDTIRTHDRDKSLEEELSQLEYETFGTEFSNEDTRSRIKRLNSVNKARKSSNRYDSQKFSQRMSTAMEIGAMILMILAMVL